MRSAGNGVFVGIPLSLFQVALFSNTAVPIGPLFIANNFLLGSAIYDADRIESPQWSPDRIPSRIAAVASCTYYSTHSLPALVPLILYLHFGYTAIKPSIAPLKPFIVSALWTMCIYYTPLWVSHASNTQTTDLLTPLFVFLSILSLSHVADVADLEDDRQSGIRTPAVLMGPTEARGYAVACASLSAFIHELSPSACLWYDMIVFSVVLGTVMDSVLLVGAMSLFLTAGALSTVNGRDLAGSLITSTDWVHSRAIAWMVDTADAVQYLPPSIRPVLIDMLFDIVRGGDRVGGVLLEVYEDIVRNQL